MPKGADNHLTVLEAVAFLDHFEGLTGPRQFAKGIYPLNEILLAASLATLGGAETFCAIS
jgi:hypothetical protein